MNGNVLEKNKMLIIIIFSFSHNVFKRLFLWYHLFLAQLQNFWRVHIGSIHLMTNFRAFGDEKINMVQMILSIFESIQKIDGKGENYYQPFSKQALVFTCLQYKSFQTSPGFYMSAVQVF